MADEELQAAGRVRDLYRSAGDTDLDLLEVWLAGRMEVAQRLDRGELPGEDVEPAMAAAGGDASGQTGPLSGRPY